MSRRHLRLVRDSRIFEGRFFIITSNFAGDVCRFLKLIEERATPGPSCDVQFPFAFYWNDGEHDVLVVTDLHDLHVLMASLAREHHIP